MRRVRDVSSLPVPDLFRPITAADHDAVLEWNRSHVELLAPLDRDRLVELLGWSHQAVILRQDGADAGFVLTFAAGSPYDSEHYRWFAERHDAFVYLDRVVVDPAFQRTGLGTRAYDALERSAREVAPTFCLEVNLDPPNEPSLAFHRGRGYREVGQDGAPGHVVSRMEKDLSTPG